MIEPFIARLFQESFKMKIYDCFPFNNEIDLLEFRLKNYWEIVDFFVISESRFAFDGSVKALNATNFSEKMKIYKNKVRIVEYVPSQEMLNGSSANRWPLENLARQNLSIGFEDAAAGDLIILSDADEFPSFEQILNAAGSSSIVSARTPMFFRKSNHLLNDSKKWNRVRLGPARLMQDLNSIRNEHYPEIAGQEGMHLSYLESTENDVIAKHKTSAHSEIDVDTEFLKLALRVANIFKIDHLGRFNSRNFGLIRVLKEHELNDFQKLFVNHAPKYFDFQPGYCG